MKRVARSSAVMGALLLMACNQPAADQQTGTSTKSASDEAAIAQVLQQEIAAVKANDANAFMAILAADATLKPPNEPLVNSAGLRAYLDNMLANVTVNSITYTDEKTTVSGDLAVHYYGFDWTVTPKGGQPMQEKGHGIHVLQRQADGSWKIAHDTWSANAAAPAGH
jgi:uncharacterized protein (TIGR02246 family)